MKVDENGLLCCSAANKGIWIFSPDGEYVDKINVDGLVLNINWGDADNQTLYITEHSYVYKIRLNTKGYIPEFITEVEHKTNPIINDFNLSQNYPNPFNPTTIINYSIPVQSLVMLKVFDVLGREVSELVNKEQSVGNYEVEFDASDLTSGIYFYRIQAGDFVDTKKMVLLR